ncbi:hypothetical protein BHE74_00044724 [Ensete ventricosum]|nr:hypothetical protein GW17_00060697 [Ensete ventricosum]RWW49151.1 hypothetical protein BHE74_00044724 [Ensete ventricosum]
MPTCMDSEDIATKGRDFTCQGREFLILQTPVVLSNMYEVVAVMPAGLSRKGKGCIGFREPSPKCVENHMDLLHSSSLQISRWTTMEMTPLPCSCGTTVDAASVGCRTCPGTWRRLC